MLACQRAPVSVSRFSGVLQLTRRPCRDRPSNAPRSPASVAAINTRWQLSNVLTRPIPLFSRLWTVIELSSRQIGLKRPQVVDWSWTEASQSVSQNRQGGRETTCEGFFLEKLPRLGLSALLTTLALETYHRRAKLLVLSPTPVTTTTIRCTQRAPQRRRTPNPSLRSVRRTPAN
jgi:hypothetical protein